MYKYALPLCRSTNDGWIGCVKERYRILHEVPRNTPAREEAVRGLGAGRSRCSFFGVPSMFARKMFTLFRPNIIIHRLENFVLCVRIAAKDTFVRYDRIYEYKDEWRTES